MRKNTAPKILSNRAVFFDKDGVIVDGSMYPIPPKADLLKEAIPGLVALAKTDFELIVVSNQSWIAKGKLTKDEVERIFQELSLKIKNQGSRLDAYYYCPHGSKEGCDCRKPKPGLILQAAKEHRIDISRSYMVGDMTMDILAGKRAGLTTILVRTCVGGKDGEYEVTPDFVVDDFSAAAKLILSKAK